MKHVVQYSFLCCLLMFNIAFAQQYPQTIWVPVTYYDFHADSSNPEFEQPYGGDRYHNNVVHKGMVNSTLGSDGRPTIGSTPYMSEYIKYWFRPFEDPVPGDSLHAQGDKTIPCYHFTGTESYSLTAVFDSFKTVNTDTAFKNMVFQDSLPFIYDNNGKYKYENGSFFPLDNKGFGKEKKDHNYSFTMVLHWNFVKTPGQTFNFTGDDDVWAFINNQLQMDLGGVHTAQTDSFNTDQITGLQNGKSYNLDIFYAERHSKESHILITTNIISGASNLRLYGKEGTPDSGDNLPLGSSDTVTVSDTYSLFGHVFDSTGTWVPENDNLITWEIDGNSGSLSSTTGSKTTFSATQTGQVTLIAKFKDPDKPDAPVSQTQITLYVVSKSVPPPPPPPPPKSTTYKIVLYPSADVSSTPLPTSDNVVAGDTYTIFGHVLTDSGKWISGYDSLITWQLIDTKGNALSPLSGSKTIFSASQANSQATIIAKFKNPDNPSGPEIQAQIVLNVKPGARPPAYTIVLYPTPDTSSSPSPDRDSMSVDTAYNLYAHVFDTSHVWLKDMDTVVKWRILETNSGAVLSSKVGPHCAVSATTAGVEFTVAADFSDPNNLARPSSEDRIVLYTEAGVGYAIRIITDSTKVSIPAKDLTFGKNQDSQPLYAIVVDKYGNFVRWADQASWRPDDIAIVNLTKTDGKKTDAVKQATGLGEQTKIIAFEEGLIPDTLLVGSSGNQTIGVLKNPFTPGTVLSQQTIPPAVWNYYQQVILNSGRNPTGTLVAVETSRPLEPLIPGEDGKKGASYARVFVYDAVGNIIRDDIKLLWTGISRNYALVWDGCNANGRKVGLGTYLFIIHAKQNDGKKVNMRTKVGVLKYN